VVADDRGTDDVGLGIDLAPHPPDAGVDPEARHVDFDPAVENVLVGAHVGGEGADVFPIALRDMAEQRQARLQELREHLPEKSTGRPPGCGRRSRVRGRRSIVDRVGEDLTQPGFSRNARSSRRRW